MCLQYIKYVHITDGRKEEFTVINTSVNSTSVHLAPVEQLLEKLVQTSQQFFWISEEFWILVSLISGFGDFGREYIKRIHGSFPLHMHTAQAEVELTAMCWNCSGIQLSWLEYSLQQTNRNVVPMKYED